MAKEELFRIQQKVVYPGQGVGEVTEICTKKFHNETLTYYVIYLGGSDMTVLIPVNRAEELGLRTIVSKQSAQHALEFLSQEFDPIPSDWKARYQMNLDLFKSGAILDNASIVRALYHRSKVKELPVQERKLYDSAYRILQDEILFAMDVDRSEIETIIHTHLEPFTPETVQESAALQDDADMDADDFHDEEDDGDER